MVESTQQIQIQQQDFLSWYLINANKKRKGEIGYYFEDFVRHFVYNQPYEALGKNDTKIHDIDIDNNEHSKETVSIKATGTTTIGCGDAIRLFNYDFNHKHSMIIFQYEKEIIAQPEDGQTSKLLVKADKFDYTQEIHNGLFGNISLSQLEHLRTLIKEVPKESEPKFEEKKQQVHNYRNSIIGTALISLDYKISSTNRRLQCSVTFNKLKKLGVKFYSKGENVLDLGNDFQYTFPTEIPYDILIGQNKKIKNPVQTSRRTQTTHQRSKTVARPLRQPIIKDTSADDALLKKYYRTIIETQKTKTCLLCKKVITQQKDKLIAHAKTHNTQ